MNRGRLGLILLVVVIVSLLLGAHYLLQVRQAEGLPQIPRRAVIDVQVVDEIGRPLSNVRVYVFAVYDDKPTKIVGAGLTDRSGHASIEFYFDDDLYKRVLRERFLNLFIHCYQPNKFVEVKAISLPPPYQASLTITHKLGRQNSDGALTLGREALGLLDYEEGLGSPSAYGMLASETEAPELVDYEEKPRQLTWITEIHSVQGVKQTIEIYKNSYIKVDALFRTGTSGPFSTGGSLSITFYEYAYQYVENGDAYNVKGYYTYVWERWLYPDGTIVEHAYCDHWEGLLLKSGAVGGDGVLPPYLSNWHWYMQTGGGGFGHGVKVSYSVSVGAKVHFEKIDMTLEFGVTAEYSSGFWRRVDFSGSASDIYYIYDRGLGTKDEPEYWPFIYVAREG